MSAVLFFVLALIAAVAGFGFADLIGAGLAAIAIILFWIFLALFVITLLMGIMRVRA